MHLVIPTFFYKLTKNEFKNNTTLSKSIVVSIFFMIVYFIFVETVLFTIGGIGIKDTAPYFFLELRDINTLMLVVDIMVYIIIVELMININFFLIR